MTTRQIHADHLSTRHELVENGTRHRVALKVCEVRRDGSFIYARVRDGDGIASRMFAHTDPVTVVA